MDNSFTEAPFLLALWAFPWGIAVFDSDGLCDGVTAWRWDEAEPFLDEFCFGEDAALALIASAVSGA